MKTKYVKKRKMKNVSSKLFTPISIDLQIKKR